MHEGLIELLYRALTAPLGIVVRTSDPERLRARLYAARKHSPDFEIISIKPSHTNPVEELWLVKNNLNPKEPTANG